MTKICKSCNNLLPLKEYHLKKDSLDGHRSRCKICRSKERKIRYSLNKEYEKSICKQYATNNKEKIAIKNKEWSQKNKQHIAFREKSRRHTDIQYRLTGNLRKRLNHALNKDQKTGSAICDLGCPIEDFKRYLESQFKSWMNWDNYGRYNKNKRTWQIDHIKPLSLFNLLDYEQFKKACHYTNCQPMLAKDNLSKGSKYDY